MPIVADDEWIIAVTPAAIRTHLKRSTKVSAVEARDQLHDLGHVAQRPQAAGHQVEAVEDQREAHAGERDVADLLALGEAVDQREDAGEDQPERSERQRDQAVAERGADVGAHDDADRRPQARRRRH